MLDAIVQVIHRRHAAAADDGHSRWQPGSGVPLLAVLVDDVAAAADDRRFGYALDHGPAVGVAVILVTQPRVLDRHVTTATVVLPDCRAPGDARLVEDTRGGRRTVALHVPLLTAEQLAETAAATSTVALDDISAAAAAGHAPTTDGRGGDQSSRP